MSAMAAVEVEGRGLRAAVAIAMGAVAAVVALTITAGASGSLAVAVPMAVLSAAAVAAASWRWPIVAGDLSAVPRALPLLSGVATLVALVQLGRLAVFMLAPAQVGYSQYPSSDWEVRHSCLSAYFVAAQAAPTTPNVFDDALYSVPGTDPAAPRQPLMLGPFKIDAYEYPPPFLLLPRAIGLVASDFPRFRAIWFGLNVGVAVAAMLLVARVLGPGARTRAVLLVPFAWAGIPILNTLQKGNVQLLIIAISTAAMALFARRRWAAGALLLAYATVTKLYPGMLLVYLLVRRRWRALGWTVAWSGILVLLTFLDLGVAPFRAFLDHLPGLLGGEAFPVFRNPGGMAINISIPGLVFKLKLFGVAGMSFPAAKIVGWIYTLVALALTIRAGRHGRHEGGGPSAWLAILILATLRSPFLPQGYGCVPALWLLTLLAATRPLTPRNLLLLGAAWLALNVFFPMDGGLSPRALALLSTLPQVTVALVALAGLGRANDTAAAVVETVTAAA